MERYACLVVCWLLASWQAWPLEAQKGRGPTKSIPMPAAAHFKCPGTLCASPDSISADGFDAVYDAADGAALNTNGEFAMRFPDGSSRRVHLEFGHAIEPCVQNCRKDFTSLEIGAGQEALIQTNVVDAFGEQVDGGLLAIPIGGAGQALLKITFSTMGPAGETFLWAVRFNPADFPGSDSVSVRRIEERLWVIDAPEGTRARLMSKQLRKRGDTDEGLYTMPFTLTVRAY